MSWLLAESRWWSTSPADVGTHRSTPSSSNCTSSSLIADSSFPASRATNFGDQEAGTAAEILAFSSATYGVAFPMSDKIEVNGADRDPIYEVLTQTPYADAAARDINWNFEKFVVTPKGKVVGCFRPTTQPDDPAVLACIAAALADTTLA